MYSDNSKKVVFLSLLCSFLFSSLVFLNFSPKGSALDKAVDPTEVPEAWDFPINDNKLNHTLGTGVKVAIIDSGIDWQHPDFYRPNYSNTFEIMENNGGQPYIDFDKDGAWDYGEQAVINHTSIMKNGKNYASTEIDLGIDYGYNDENLNEQYDYGQETICYYQDEDQNGQINSGDTAIALGESKIDIIRDYWNNKIYVNGVNLTDPGINNEVDTDGHGTHVAGIIAGGWPTLRNFTGVAPNSTLMVYKYNNPLQAILDAVNDGADIISISLGQYFRDLSLDGSPKSEGGSYFDEYVDWAYDQGVPVVVSAGNSANDNAHTYNEIPAMNSQPGSFSIQFDLQSYGSNPYELDFTNLWLSPHNKIGVNITIPNPEGAGTITIPDEYYDPTLAWDGQPHEYLPSGLSQPLIIKRYRNQKNINGVNKSFINITYTGGNLASGNGEYTVLNFGSNVQKVHSYIHTIQSNSAWYSGWPASEWTEYINKNYTLTSPATANHSITVGSFISDGTNLGEISIFSSRGPRIDGKRALDLIAPGEVLLAAASKDDTTESFDIGDYTDKQGTSMATPFISGVIALAMESNSELQRNPELVKDLLLNSTFEDEYTKKFGEGYNNVTGYGKINASLMLQNVQGPTIGKPTLKTRGFPYPINISVQVNHPTGISEVWLYYTNDSWANTYSIKLSNTEADDYFGQLLYQDSDVKIQYYLKAIDLFGLNNTNDNSTNYFTYHYKDLISPKVFIEKPSSGAIYYDGESIDINASIFDDETYILEAKALVNSSQPFNVSMSLISGDWYCQWSNLSLYNAGDYKITIWAIDQGNNINQTESVVVRLVKDLVPPNIFFESPLNKTSFSEPFNITASITDDNLPTKNNVFAIIYNETSGFSVNLTMVRVMGTNNWTVKWVNLSNYKAGVYYINITAFDSSYSNNRNETGYLQITYIDTYAPSVQIIDPSSGSVSEPPDDIHINATVIELESSISKVKAMINASTQFNLSMVYSYGQWNCVWNNISENIYNAGDYNITIWASDVWGNINATESTVITISKDLDAPFIFPHYPINNSVYIGPLNITAEVHDDHIPHTGDVYATIWNDTISFNLSMAKVLQTNNWTVQWQNITKYSPGYYYINITAIDSSFYRNLNTSSYLNISYQLDTIPPIINFQSPYSNNTKITTETYEFEVIIKDHNLPEFGDVKASFLNNSFLFNISLSFNGKNLWSFTWNNASLYSNGNYTIKLFVRDSSPNTNENFAILFITLNIISQEPTKEASEPKPPFIRLWEAFTSSEILTICGIIGGAILFELFLAHKSRPYEASQEERERILNMMDEEDL